MILAGWRALTGKRIIPGFRETVGTAALVLSVGAFSHIAFVDPTRPYPAGGLLGAIIGERMTSHFATIGAGIIAVSMVLASLALAADGILRSFGLRGLQTLATSLHGLKVITIYMRERRRERLRRHQERQEERAKSFAKAGQARESAAINQADAAAATGAAREESLKHAAERGQDAGARAAETEWQNFLNAQTTRNITPKAGATAVMIGLRGDGEELNFDLIGQDPGNFTCISNHQGAPPSTDSHSPHASDLADKCKDPSEVSVNDDPDTLCASCAADDIVVLSQDDVEEHVPIRAATPPRARRLRHPTVVKEQALTDSVDSVVELDEDHFEPNNASASLSVPAIEQQATRATESSSESVDPNRENSSNDQAEAPAIVDRRPTVEISEDLDARKPPMRLADEEGNDGPGFELPPASLLEFVPEDGEALRAGTYRGQEIDGEVLRQNAQRLIEALADYGVEGKVREIRPGPVVTMYEVVPKRGTKVSRISGLANELAMSMEALRVRVVAPIPGKGAVGIEIPNKRRETVFLKEIIGHSDFSRKDTRLPIGLGKDIEGQPLVADLARMPHLLVAGATGSGKSVFINAVLMSVLFRATPDDVKLLLVDPKMLELSIYEGIPHLLLPVVTDPKKAALALRWAVTEMERRYQLLTELGVRNIDGYNKKIAKIDSSQQPTNGRAKTEPPTSLPYIVIVVDELADLMMVAPKDVEYYIQRLAQMARAAGIHLLLATQRPSTDVITGVIKANLPTRIAFQVASRHDSATILGTAGAEFLLGRGDMLYQPPGADSLCRVHGAFVDEDEIAATVDFLQRQAKPKYDDSIVLDPDEDSSPDVDPELVDDMYENAIAIIAESQQASVSMIQRRLRIGYNRAARIMEMMERERLVGPADGSKPREVLVPCPGM